jgi:hypothetical protein
MKLSSVNAGAAMSNLPSGLRLRSTTVRIGQRKKTT